MGAPEKARVDSEQWTVEPWSVSRVGASALDFLTARAKLAMFSSVQVALALPLVVPSNSSSCPPLSRSSFPHPRFNHPFRSFASAIDILTTVSTSSR